MDIAGLVLVGLPLLFFGGGEVFAPVPVAFAITTLLAIASYYPFIRMGGGSMNRYMTAMLLGMFIRMIFIGISVAVVFVFTELHQISFTVALLISYICKSAFETYILTR
jgi:hypothetical protein